jgi:hypothetical protein
MALADVFATLARHRVEFVVVGGMAGALQGAPVQTFDIELVYARDEVNITRLLGALHELDAVFRVDARGLRPNESHLRSSGHKLLRTAHGALDVLGSIEEDMGYAELLADSVELEVAGVVVRVITLERLIRINEKLTRPTDVAMLLVLRATLAESRRTSRDP